MVAYDHIPSHNAKRYNPVPNVIAKTKPKYRNMPSHPASRYPRKIEPALPPSPLTIARGTTDVADSTAMQ